MTDYYSIARLFGGRFKDAAAPIFGPLSHRYILRINRSKIDSLKELPDFLIKHL